MLELSQANAQCHVFTQREGLMAAVGHDLKLAVTRFSIRVGDNGNLTATLDAASLVVVASMHGAREDPASPSAKDRAQIERTIRDDVLQSRRHADIRFTAAAVNPPDGASTFTGMLVLHGETRPVKVEVLRHGGGVVATALLHQPAFGITPYSAMLGALRLKPDVLVRVEAGLTTR